MGFSAPLMAVRWPGYGGVSTFPRGTRTSTTTKPMLLPCQRPASSMEYPLHTELLASFPYLNLHLHAAGPRKALETEWLGFVGGPDFRLALTEALRLARAHYVTGWVADDRLLGSLRPKDLDWGFTHLHEPLAELGVRRFALLETEETLNRFIINSKYQEAMPGLPFELRFFTNLTEARSWACA